MTEETVKAIQDLFIIRDDCYAVQQEGKNEYIVVKKPLAPELILGHLDGLVTIGVFQINPTDNKVKWICFDFDGELAEEFEKAKKLFTRLKEAGYNPLLEFSGRRGYHVWLFIEPVDASIARKFAKEMAEGIDVDEIFPKQDKIEAGEFGGQVKLPLGIHRDSMKHSYIFDEHLNILDNQNSKLFLVKISGRKDKIELRNLKKFIF